MNETRLELRVCEEDRVVILERRGTGRRVRYHRLTLAQAGEWLAEFLRGESSRFNQLNARFVERGERGRAAP
ncbi:MAG: hypothetical protein IT356_00040 [Gemmatimonadaceae bacterium]|nr:hypothetical protein [Gemmatimonadaceae bacterium]